MEPDERYFKTSTVVDVLGSIAVLLAVGVLLAWCSSCAQQPTEEVVELIPISMGIDRCPVTRDCEPCK